MVRIATKQHGSHKIRSVIEEIVMYDIRFINRTDEQCYARKVSRQNRRKLPAIFFYSVANLRYAFELKKKEKRREQTIEP